MIGDSARALDALRGTIIQLQRSARGLEQALASTQKRAGEQEDKIQQLLRDGKVAEMKVSCCFCSKTRHRASKNSQR